MKTTTRTDEIRVILDKPLNGTKDIIDYIINIEKKLNQNESFIYWNHIYHNDVHFINPYFKQLKGLPGYIFNLHEQIHRMNGSLELVRIENKELKTIKINNDKLTKEWHKLSLLPKKRMK